MKIDIFGVKGTLGIEFTKENVKIMLLSQSKEKQEIVFYDSFHIKDVSELQISQKIADIIRLLPVKNFNVQLILPVSGVITKTIQIPSVDDKEIRDILSLQAGRQTPYSRDELVLDYITLGKYQEIYTKILVVMVTKEYINEKNDILESAGLKLASIKFGPEGICRWFSSSFKPETFSSVRCLLDIDAESSGVSIYSEQGILFTRNIPVGSKKLKERDENAVKRFVNEIKKTIVAYQAEDISGSPNIIFVPNRQILDDDIKNKIEENAKVDVHTVDIKEYLVINEKTKSSLSQNTGVSFLSVALNIITDPLKRLELLPDEIKLKRKYEKRAHKIISAGALLMVIFFQICMIFITKMYYMEQYLNKIKARYKEKINEADTLRALSKKSGALSTYISDKDDTLEVLAILYDMLPEEIYLKGITIDKEGNVFIKGTSKTMSRIFSFVTELENNPVFESVKTEYTESKKEQGEDVSDFGIVMGIEGRFRPEENENEGEE